MFAVGDIARIYAPTAGKKKYFLCVKVGDDESAHKFLFINSDPNFDDLYVVDNARVPCIPPSDTEKTCFSFSIVLHYTDKQLKDFQGEKIGVLDKFLAAELLAYAQKVTSLTSGQKAMVLAALASI